MSKNDKYKVFDVGRIYEDDFDINEKQKRKVKWDKKKKNK